MRSDLRTIEGTIELPHCPELQLVDALSQLPSPLSDLSQQRTWPGSEDHGRIQIGDPDGAGRRHFVSELPQRYGASGRVPGRGLFVNGLWHPQPTVNQRVAVARWEVELHLPDGSLGVLNTAVGSGVLRWSGEADRLALAVIPGGEATPLLTPSQALVLVQGPRSSSRRADHIRESIPTTWPVRTDTPVVVVLAPMHRRLSRPGPGMVFLSERAGRLSAGLWRHHSRGIQRGILTASIPNSDPWARGLVGSGLLSTLPAQPSAKQALSWLSWIPDIDAVLYDGTLPFNSEVMGHTWPSDPVDDDLLQIIESVVPSQVAFEKLRGIAGDTATQAMLHHLAEGASIDDAAERSGVPLSLVAAWRTQPPPQNLSVHHTKTPQNKHVLTVRRETTASAPPEPIRVEIDGTAQTWISTAGPDQRLFELDRAPSSVRVDPLGAVRQTRRDDDGWPPRWQPTFALGLTELDLSQARPSSSVHGWLRRAYGTRWVYGAHLSTSSVDLFSGAASISRSLGPLINQRRRSFQIWGYAGASILDPSFRPTEHGSVAIDTAAGAGWDTTDSWPLPTRGHRLSSSLGLGWVPRSEQRWTSWQVSGSHLLPLSGRLVLASRGAGGVALGGIPHRQRSLGGGRGVQGLQADSVLGHGTSTASAELRFLPISRASIPLPLAWGSDLQLSAGLDTGMAWTEDGEVKATGWTVGLAGVADLLGARPAMAGVWVANTIAPLSSAAAAQANKQVYLRFTQPL